MMAEVLSSVESFAPKGSVFYLSSSYYNNWYLSQELRKLGWKADTLSYVGEDAEDFLHGRDYYLKDYSQWDGCYSKGLFEFLKKILTAYSFKEKCNDFIQEKNLSGLEKIVFYILKTLFFSQISRVLNFFELYLSQPWFKNKIAVGVFNFIFSSNCFEKAWRVFFFQKLSQEDGQNLLRRMLRMLMKASRHPMLEELQVLIDSLDRYDVFHYSGAHNLHFLHFFNPYLFGWQPLGWDIQLLKILGKKIVYSNNGCLDGVSQSSFRSWPGPEPTCDSCIWSTRPDVCSDERNLAWGKLRNEVADFQINVSGNRADYNQDPRVHEIPEFYCLDPEVWRPDLEIPKKYQISHSPETVKIYHAVGNFDIRTLGPAKKNIKSSHIYLPLIERLKKEGYPVELIFAKDIPNKEVRYLQAQADIVVDMLTFGWFGANLREALMLGKTSVCYLRPIWLEMIKKEIPEYIEELPVVSATPQTVETILKELISDPDRRHKIGEQSRLFALKWHAAGVAAKKFDNIYSKLIRSQN